MYQYLVVGQLVFSFMIPLNNATAIFSIFCGLLFFLIFCFVFTFLHIPRKNYVIFPTHLL